ncbi:MAG: hypothetical protein US81_C0003G0010 [Parcubacteria group bacterium GW2011_GWE2_38_18]|nr:MAG: hypothetical protein US81_C0003G0010 [Parcubacteria group bacterium GW2011_GWE2_38_18]
MKFDQIGEKQSVSNQWGYEILQGATHVRLYAGKLSFGISDLKEDLFTGRGKFFLIPAGTRHVSFPDFNCYDGCCNFDYGRPQFTR